MALYKHAVDLSLIYSDTVFNQGSDGHGPRSQMQLLRSLAISYESAEDHNKAAGLYEDLTNAPNNGIEVDASINRSRLYGDCARIYEKSYDYVKAEVFGVASLHQMGPAHWDWNLLLNGLQSETGFVHYSDRDYKPLSVFPRILRIYQNNSEAVMCKLRTNDEDVSMFKVYALLGPLLATAGYPCQSGGVPLDVLQNSLKPKYRKMKEARRAIADAFTSRTIEECHACILKTKSYSLDLDRKFSEIMNSIDPRTIPGQQAAFFERRKQETKAEKRDDTNRGFGISDLCRKCGIKVKSRDIKECPCKMVLYCSKSKFVDLYCNTVLIRYLIHSNVNSRMLHG